MIVYIVFALMIGTTPWGSWLTCEETTLGSTDGDLTKNHGYIFEVPATGTELTAGPDPKPYNAMGRFSPDDKRAGVAKPPINPSRAMKIESRRIESPTATAVTTSIRKNTTPAGARCHSACTANSVA